MNVKMPDWAQCLFDESLRYIVFRGGRGSAKTESIARALAIRGAQKPLFIVCGREIQKSVKDSVKKSLEDAIKDVGLESFYDFLDQEIRGENGTKFVFVGVKSNPDSIKSISRPDIFWGEEAQTFSTGSILVIEPTFRKETSQIIYSYNPKFEKDPIEQQFFIKPLPPRSKVLTVNFDDNPWFPDVLREKMEFDRNTDKDKYEHVWMGGYLKNSEARVFKNWQVEHCEPPNGAIFRYGADFGFSIDPSVLVRCWIEGHNLYIDHEAYQLKCEIDKLPDLFMTVPESEKWPVVADSSRPETISYLRKHGFPKILAAVKGARSVEEGIEFLKSYAIIVHPRCQNVIDELTLYSYKIDPDTQQVLPFLADKDNHCIVAGTFVATRGGRKKIEDVTTSDFVMTRAGFKPVLFAGVTDVNRDVVRIKTTHGELVCTPDHRIFTANKGFIRADALKYDDEILSFPKESSWLKQLSITERFTGAIQMLSGALTVFISSAQSLVELCGFTGKCGPIKMGPSQMARTSITKMEILQTTLSLIWSALLQRPTPTLMNGQLRDASLNPCTLKELGRLRGLGTPALKELKSTEKLEHRHTKILFLWLSRALNVVRSSCLRSWAVRIAFAQTNANQHGAGRLASITRKEYASNAQHLSSATNTGGKKLVLGRVLTVTAAGKADKVYDLSVEELPEFFANSILVHNCIDALRYACEGVRRAKVAPVISTPLPIASSWR